MQWSNLISNNDIWQQAGLFTKGLEIKKMHWEWIHEEAYRQYHKVSLEMEPTGIKGKEDD